MGAPWLSSSCPSYPHLTLLSGWILLKQILTQALPTITTQAQQSTNKNQLCSSCTFTLLLPDKYPATVSPQNLPPLFLSRHKLTYTTHKDGPKHSTMVAWWLKQPHSEPSNWEPFLETCITKTWEVPSTGSPKKYKQASLSNKDISHPNHYHPFQLKHLPQVSWPVHSLHTTQVSPKSAHLTSHQRASF